MNEAIHPFLGVVFYLAVFVVLFNLAITLGEWLYDVIKKNPRDHADTRLNFANGVIFYVIEFLVVGAAVFAAVQYFSQFAPVKVKPNLISFLLSVVIGDFIFYWGHRAKHSFRFLWSWHVVHHNSTSLNLSTSYRLAWIEPFFEWIFAVPLVLLGFDPYQAIFSMFIVALYQHWIHSSKIGSLGFLEYFMNTPQNHRVHHGARPEYVDRNFGAIFIIWDKLFGTFEPFKAETTYGLKKQNFYSKSLLWVHHHEIVQLTKDVFTAPSWAEKWRRFVSFDSSPRPIPYHPKQPTPTDIQL